MTTPSARHVPAPARQLDELRVADAMHPGVLSCPVDAPLTDVARVMAAHRVHCVIVLGTDQEDDVALEGRLWGVVSDFDLVTAIDSIDRRTAGDTAITPAVLIAPDDTLAHAALLMREHQVSHLVVASPASPYPVGVLSTLDIAYALVKLSKPACACPLTLSRRKPPAIRGAAPIWRQRPTFKERPEAKAFLSAAGYGASHSRPEGAPSS
jgi:CBS domain-containing protein